MSIIAKKERQGKIVIDLTGEQGNAHFLIGYADQLGKQLGLDKPQRVEIQQRMMGGDYENLITVFDNNFGEYVDLAR
jgi:hypothetical protein